VRALAIIPAFNEAEAIGKVVDEVLAFDPDLDVLVVDDASHDGTRERARQHGARVVRLPFNLGIGGAVQAGFRYAAVKGYDVVVRVDGDGQHDPAELGPLMAVVLSGRADICVGSRFAEGEGYRSSATRRIGIRVLASTVSLLTRQRVTDTTSGFQVLNRKAILLFAQDYPHDYPEVEAVLLMHAHQLTSVEVPVKMRERAGGVSSINSTRSVYYMIKVLLAVFVGLFRARPAVRAGEPSPVTAEPGI
jgi:glycosyltransferase involved in cell wall biosynthesis